MTSWTYAAGGAPAGALPERDPDWTPAEGVEISIELLLDLDAARERLGLHATATLSAAILWASDATRRHGASEAVRVVTGLTIVRASIPGHLLGGTLELRAVITVSSPGIRSNDGFAPRAPQAIVWEEGRTLRLEGTGAQLPVIALEFSGRERPEHAPWRFQLLNPDLASPLGSAFLLELNAKHPTVRALTEGEDVVLPHVVPLLDAFIARNLLHQLLSEFDIEEQLSHSFEAGSLGSHVKSLLAAISGVDAEEGLRMYRDERPLFDLRIDAEIGRFR
ncbi:hypothetical protein [Agrococcus sp. TSP3-2-1]|uniref:hypothetical protein n=1 Tax=Agrococcus sp. TSP3-2-1 TaxID=2804583 RepID=UPI003CFA2AD5